MRRTRTGTGPDSQIVSRKGFATIALAALAALAATQHNSQVAAQEPRAEFVINSTAFVQLPDGRRLAYSEYGDPKASNVIIHHHGFSSCRLEAEVFLGALRQRPGIRLLAIDRPGIGQSDRSANLHFLTWPTDLAMFANALHIDRFSVSATSGGTPYALAAARAMPDRVTAVTLASPIAPYEAVSPGRSGARGAILAQRHPVLTRMALNRFITRLGNNPDRFGVWYRFLAPPDQQLLAQPAEHSLFVRITSEAFRQGTETIRLEAARLADPWAYWLGEVRVPVTIHQGWSDSVTPPAMAAYLASALPRAEVKYVEGEAHVSLPMRRADDILLAGAKTTGPPREIAAASNTEAGTTKIESSGR